MTRRKTTEEFIEDASRVHGDKYDYSLVDYRQALSKVLIICPEHGRFSQTASEHLSGRGCSLCGRRQSSETRRRKAAQAFVAKAKKIHGDKYDYSKVKYACVRDPIIITCYKHGDFQQVPNDHLTEAGCPQCARESSYYSWRSSYCTEFKTAYLYVVQMADNFIKVGVTQNVAGRVKRIARENGGEPVKIIRVIKGDCRLIWKAEREVHQRLCKHRVKGLTFKGATECYPVSFTKPILEHLEGRVS